MSSHDKFKKKKKNQVSFPQGTVKRRNTKLGNPNLFLVDKRKYFSTETWHETLLLLAPTCHTTTVWASNCIGLSTSCLSIGCKQKQRERDIKKNCKKKMREKEKSGCVAERIEYMCYSRSQKKRKKKIKESRTKQRDVITTPCIS